ncbi:hypothetical protein [Aliivibrio finisterrensis]|uniref:Beta-lactamase n=1 Tax=Aliivibrio finisterrensis TaxID=511998 RepID=A0A6N6RT05_9GAMM|nr:hypothetical protein [Aliivibrio finisterrensis]KAB2824766.1 hypothetical protein F8B77_09255 [Aliivibrio finisterrensis]
MNKSRFTLLVLPLLFSSTLPAKEFDFSSYFSIQDNKTVFDIGSVSKHMTAYLTKEIVIDNENEWGFPSLLSELDIRIK